MDITRKKKAAAAIVIALLLKKKKSRSCWTRNWILRRSTYGVTNVLLEELRVEDPLQLRNFLRMSASQFEELECKIGHIIKRQDTVMRQAVSVRDRLHLTLRFLATGDSYSSLQYLFRIPKNTISLIVPDVCQAIYTILGKEYIKMPCTPNEWASIEKDFLEKWNFPHCIGALDGKHIVMQAPPNSGSYFYNYKGTHSIVLMALVDANYRFIYVDVGCNGRISDGGVFSNCTLSHELYEGKLNVPPPSALPGRQMLLKRMVVADDAFPLRDNMMKPYPFREQPGPVRVFNYRLSRTRRVVENAFGLLTTVFRVFRKPLAVGPHKTEKIVLATVALHNFLLSGKSAHYRSALDLERGQDHTVFEGTWRMDGMPTTNAIGLDQVGSNNYTVEAKKVRDELKEYFMTPEGEVPWQYKHI